MYVQRQSGVVATLQSWLARAKQYWRETVKPWAEANPKTAALIGTGAVAGGMLYIGGSVLVNGLIAGSLVAGSVGILLYKMKQSHNRTLMAVYNVVVNHPFASDVALSGLAMLLAPGGITGWVAAAVTGLITSVWLLGAEPVELPREELPRELLNTVIEQCGD